MLSVIIPVYNRRGALLLCLGALDRQSCRDFEVIVADDGSDDLPVEVLINYPWHFPYLYVRQERKGVRIGQARNLGAKLASGTGLVFVDSDVLLNPTALGHYTNIHQANPDAIIGGRYDWLPPLQITLDDVQSKWKKVVSGDLPKREVGEAYLGLQGQDPREVANDVWFDSDAFRYDYCLALFSGNMLWPARIFREIGGFDENMTGHGGEDCELAMRAQERGLPALFSYEVIGYHVWHPRDQERNMREVKANVEYIRAHHDILALGVKLGKVDELPLVGGTHAS